MTETNMPSKRQDITLDPKIIAMLEWLVDDWGSNMNKSAMIAMLIRERYEKTHKKDDRSLGELTEMDYNSPNFDDEEPVPTKKKKKK